MIQDGKIFYSATLSPILSLRPGNQAIFSITVAVLTTLVSYQTAATLIDLLFGLKASGGAKASDLHIHHLASTSSPLAVTRSIFPGKSVPDAGRDGTAEGHDKVARPTAILKLLLALVIAPLCNILTVALTLENDSKLTISEAGVGGLALGVKSRPNFPQQRNIRSRLTLARINTEDGDEPLVEFFLMLGPVNASMFQTEPGIARVVITGQKQHEIVARIETPFGSASRTKTAQVTFSEGPGEGETFFLRNHLDPQVIDEWLDFGVDALGKFCQSTEVLENRSATNEPGEVDLLRSRTIRCPGQFSVRRLFSMLKSMTDRVEIVESEKLEIAKASDISGRAEDFGTLFFQPNEYLFMNRRRSFASFMILVVLLLGVLVFRAFIYTITRNDLDSGMGLITRHVLGVPWFYSLLAAENVWVQHEQGMDSVNVFETAAGFNNGAASATHTGLTYRG